MWILIPWNPTELKLRKFHIIDLLWHPRLVQLNNIARRQAELLKNSKSLDNLEYIENIIYKENKLNNKDLNNPELIENK